LTYIESILEPGVIKKDGLYARGSAGPRTIWDDLAAQNPIQAAISVETEEQERTRSRPMVDVLAAELTQGRVLDLGCGYGRVAKYLLARRTFDAYIGVDGSTTMLRLFESRYASRDVERRTPLVLIHSSIDETLLEDASVDAVFSCAVLLHNPKGTCQRAINEAHRVLKPGGKLIVLAAFPNRYTASGAFGSLYQGIYRLRGEAERNGPVRYFSEGEVRRLLAGYRKVDIRRVGFHALPSRYPFIPGRLNEIYRSRVFAPVQGIAERLPSQVRELSCLHLDAIAIK
jgi:ubiquinone/menaquinone biosynthesis C-methylase UbiE